MRNRALLPERLAALNIILTIALVVGLFFEVRSALREVEAFETVHVPITELSGIIVRLDEKLSNSAAFYALTKDSKWRTQYEAFLPALADSVDQYRALMPAAGLNITLVEGFSRSRVEAIERDALLLVERGAHRRATQLLKAKEYIVHKEKFRAGVDLVNETLAEMRNGFLTRVRTRKEIAIVVLALGVLVLILNWTFLLIQFRRNLRERDLAESALEEERANNIHATRMATLGEMAGGVAHEINNPLTIIRGYVAVLRKLGDADTLDKEKLLQMTEVIEKTVQRVSKITKGMRMISRDGHDDPFERTSVAHLIEDTLPLCNERFKFNGVRLDMEEVSPELVMECRSSQISQVLLNLLNNSIDAVEGLDEKWVRFQICQKGAFVEFRITDSGFGIPKDIAEKIMNPFFTTKEVGKGTGLGLSISAGFAQKHGGQLRVDPSCKNTCFVLTIPVTQEGREGESADAA